MIYRVALEDPDEVLRQVGEDVEFFYSVKSRDFFMGGKAKDIFDQYGIQYDIIEVIDPEKVPLYYTQEIMDELKPVENSIKAKILASEGIAGICAHYADDDFLERDMIFNSNKYLYVDSPKGKKTYLWRVVNDRAEAKAILVSFFNRDEKVFAWMQWVHEVEGKER